MRKLNWNWIGIWAGNGAGFIFGAALGVAGYPYYTRVYWGFVVVVAVLVNGVCCAAAGWGEPK